MLKAQGQQEEATAYYEAYLEENPNDSKVLYELGQISFQEENYEQAVSWFEDNVISRRSLWLDCGILLSFMSEQVMGVEPTLPAWEAGVLPIYDTCKIFIVFLTPINIL